MRRTPLSACPTTYVYRPDHTHPQCLPKCCHPRRPSVRSDAFCARSKALDHPVQRIWLPCRDRARERHAGPLFDAGHELCGGYTIAVSDRNSDHIGWLVLTQHGRNGSVHFTIQGLNVNGSDGAFTLTTPSAVHQRRWFSRRGLHGSPRHVHRRSVLGDVLQSQHSRVPFSIPTPHSNALTRLPS